MVKLARKASYNTVLLLIIRELILTNRTGISGISKACNYVGNDSSSKILSARTIMRAGQFLNIVRSSGCDVDKSLSCIGSIIAELEAMGFEVNDSIPTTEDTLLMWSRNNLPTSIGKFADAVHVKLMSDGVKDSTIFKMIRREFK